MYLPNKKINNITIHINFLIFFTFHRKFITKTDYLSNLQKITLIKFDEFFNSIIAY